ncbi:DUF6302 family protein [Streptomyces sp. NPDC048479]|uniref:DUF6302 family protein n=1 Tax=Streptomyces sp. NPDC048479 TaxID=3154725 RepID=UPI00343FD6E5
MSAATTPLSIALLPPGEAYDFEFVASRLSDASLLDRSVAVRIHRAPLLAVPVGGPRRGGYFDAGTAPVALAVRDLLLARPGFPLLRIRLVSERWIVEWGECPPARPSREASARFYGYGSPSVPHPFADPTVTTGTLSGQPDAEPLPPEA